MTSTCVVCPAQNLLITAFYINLLMNQSVVERRTGDVEVASLTLTQCIVKYSVAQKSKPLSKSSSNRIKTRY